MHYKTPLKMFVAVFLLSYVFSIIDFSSILLVLKKANVKMLVGGFLLAVVNQIVVSNIKWSLILKAYESFVPFKELCAMYLKGMFFSMFLPGVYGGDFVRAYHISRYTEKKVEGVMSVILERLTGLWGMILILLLAILYEPTVVPSSIRFWSMILSVVFLVGFFLVFSKQVLKKIKVFSELIGGKISSIIGGTLDSLDILANKRVVFFVLMYSLVFQFLVTATNYMIALSLGAEISFVCLLVSIPIISLFSMIPITFNGIGVRDISYIGILGLYGVERETAFSIGLIAFMMGVLMSLFGGILYLKDK